VKQSFYYWGEPFLTKILPRRVALGDSFGAGLRTLTLRPASGSLTPACRQAGQAGGKAGTIPLSGTQNPNSVNWRCLLVKIRTFFERNWPAPWLRPRQRRGAKQNIFLFFQFWRATLVLLKGIEKCFSLLLLTEQESGAAPTPAAPSARWAGGQKFTPSNSPNFCPPVGGLN